MIDPGLMGKVVLITGANNPYGIGAAAARAFARVGCPVFLSFLRESAPATRATEHPGEAFHQAAKSRSADAVVEEIRRAGGRADAWEVDLTHTSAINELFDRAEASLGPVAVLVNNAAHCAYDTFQPAGGAVYGQASPEQAVPLSPASHDLHFAVNSRAPALLMAEYARRHIARKGEWGRIINISTDAAAAHAGAISYGASKHALESYSRAAAYELGRYGVTVNVVAPGPVQTGWITLELEEQVKAKIPLGRIGTPDDIADVVVFLASQQARWVTGQTLFVGGGNVMPG